MFNLRDRVIAAFLGAAIGDALGAPLEGISWKKRKEIGRIENYIINEDRSWNGRLLRGQWTDDTQLTLVVAESLIANSGRINMDDMAARHVAALTEAREKGWDWGRTTTLAVERLKAGVHWNESGKNLGDSVPIAQKKLRPNTAPPQEKDSREETGSSLSQSRASETQAKKSPPP